MNCNGCLQIWTQNNIWHIQNYFFWTELNWFTKIQADDTLILTNEWAYIGHSKHLKLNIKIGLRSQGLWKLNWKKHEASLGLGHQITYWLMIIKLQILTDLSAFITLHPSTLKSVVNYNLFLLLQRVKASLEFGPVLKLKTRLEYNCSFEPQDRTDWTFWPLTQSLNTFSLHIRPQTVRLTVSPGLFPLKCKDKNQ